MTSAEEKKAKQKARSRAHYLRNRAEKNAYQKAWRAKNREREVVYRKRAAAVPGRFAGYLKKYREKHRARIKERRRWARIRRSAGIGAMEFKAIMELQSCACAICRREFTETLPPCVDHCHDTNIGRGLLCRNCNTAEGHIKQTGIAGPEFGARLDAYLANPPAGIAELG